MGHPAADDLWMSPAYRRDSVAIHFTWKPEWPAVQALLPVIEKELAPFQPRPHWGKLFTISPAQLHVLVRKAARLCGTSPPFRSKRKIPQRLPQPKYFRKRRLSWRHPVPPPPPIFWNHGFRANFGISSWSSIFCWQNLEKAALSASALRRFFSKCGRFPRDSAPVS